MFIYSMQTWPLRRFQKVRILLSNPIFLELTIHFSNLCEILELPNIGESEAEVYSTISLIGRKPKTATQLKLSFRVISKWFSENFVPQVGYND